MEMTIRLEEREHSHALCVDVSQDMRCFRELR